MKIILMQFVIVIVLIRLLISLLSKDEKVNSSAKKINQKKRSVAMLKRLRRNDIQSLFSDHFVDVKMLYTFQFDKIPCISFIGEVDATQVLAYIREKFVDDTISFLQHAYYDHAEGKMFFNNAVFILENNRIIEIAPNFCQVLHTSEQYEWAMQLVNELAAFRMRVPVAGTPATVVGFARQEAMN